MGIDLEYVFQQKVGQDWVDVSSEFDPHRHSALFAWLLLGGGDQVGSCQIQPLAEERDFPPDFVVQDGRTHPIASNAIRSPTWRHHFPDTDSDATNYLKIHMGDWGFSWLHADEILLTPAPKVKRWISVPREIYQEWDGIGLPKDWDPCSPTYFMYRHREIGTAIAQDIVIQVDYDFTDEFSYFVDEVRRLQHLHGELRFVFGFY